MVERQITKYSKKNSAHQKLSSARSAHPQNRRSRFRSPRALNEHAIRRAEAVSRAAASSPLMKSGSGNYDFMNQSTDENLSFCGCGFLGVYHIGVATCFNQYAPQLSNHKVSGSSAGALAAVAHICGNLQLAYAATDFLRVAISARANLLGPLHPSFDINAILTETLEKALPDDVHVRASGKLHISLTRVYDGQNVIVSEFDSKEEVIQALLCSCFIPFWSGFIAPKFKGITYTDGGFTNNLLILDDKTVTVSPFAGEADICPQDEVYNILSVCLSNTSISITPNNLYRLSHALMPPPPEVLNELCAQGFADGIRFLQRMNFISFNAISTCLKVESSFTITETRLEQDTIEKTEIIEQQISFTRQKKLINNFTGANDNNLLDSDDLNDRKIIAGRCSFHVINSCSYLNHCIDRLPLYPFFYDCASAALVYICEFLKYGAKAGSKQHAKITELVRYLSP